jgi:hypothetical protein
MDAVEAPTCKHESVCINYVNRGLEDGKYSSLITHVEGHSVVS